MVSKQIKSKNNVYQVYLIYFLFIKSSILLVQIYLILSSFFLIALPCGRGPLRNVQIYIFGSLPIYYHISHIQLCEYYTLFTLRNWRRYSSSIHGWHKHLLTNV